MHPPDGVPISEANYRRPLAARMRFDELHLDNRAPRAVLGVRGPDALLTLHRAPFFLSCILRSVCKLPSRHLTLNENMSSPLRRWRPVLAGFRYLSLIHFSP